MTTLCGKNLLALDESTLNKTGECGEIKQNEILTNAQFKTIMFSCLFRGVLLFNNIFQEVCASMWNTV